MSCKYGGDITIYGLFPEDDILAVDEPCDWSVYPRPECIVQEYERLPNALEYAASQELVFPLASLIDVDAEFTISMDVYPTNQGAGFSVPVIEQLDYSTDERMYLTHAWRTAEANQVSNATLGASSVAGVLAFYLGDFNISDWSTIKITLNRTTGDAEVLILNTVGASHDITPAAWTPAVVQAFVVPPDFYLGGKAVSYTSKGFIYGNLKIIQGDTKAYWPIDEGTGSIFYDQSGNGNHVIAKAIGGATWVDAPYFRTNLQLHMDNSQVRIPWGSIPINTDFKIDLFVEADADSTYNILDTEGTTTADDDNLQWDVTFTTAGTGNNAVEFGTYSSSVSTGVAYPKSSKLTLLSFRYYNATNILVTEDDTTQHGTGTTSTILPCGAGPITNFFADGVLVIGDDGVNPLVGKVREIKIFATYTDYYPVAYYCLDDNVADSEIIQDRTGNGYDATFVKGSGSWVVIN